MDDIYIHIYIFIYIYIYIIGLSIIRRNYQTLLIKIMNCNIMVECFKSIDSRLNCLTTPKMEIVSQDRTIDNKQNNNHLPERKKVWENSFNYFVRTIIHIIKKIYTMRVEFTNGTFTMDRDLKGYLLDFSLAGIGFGSV